MATLALQMAAKHHAGLARLQHLGKTQFGDRLAITITDDFDSYYGYELRIRGEDENAVFAVGHNIDRLLDLDDEWGEEFLEYAVKFLTTPLEGDDDEEA